MILRVGLLIVGALLFVFLAWGAITTWIIVFSEGALESLTARAKKLEKTEEVAA